MRQGSPIIREGQGFCIDLFRAANALNDVLKVPTAEGASANARATHFEDSVQRAIQSSPWAARSSLLDLRRRKLREGGKDITDIDAIGERGTRLLLVSCKSRAFTPAHEVGDYKAIRNSATLVEDAITDARRLQLVLQERPIGTNYDVSGYTEIIVVVCTPYAVYTPIGVATEFVEDGLSRAASLPELVRWLRDETALAPSELV